MEVDYVKYLLKNRQEMKLERMLALVFCLDLSASPGFKAVRLWVGDLLSLVIMFERMP